MGIRTTSVTLFGHLYHGYHGHLYHMVICTTVTMGILTALPTDGQTDRQTDGQTDGQTDTDEFTFLDPSLSV